MIIAQEVKNMIFDIDKAILLWIKGYMRNDILTPVLRFITTLGNAGIFWIILTLILLLYNPTRKIGVVCMVALLEEFLVCNVLIKNIVKRTRPYVGIEGLNPLVKKPTDYSFPSGHSSSSFAVGFTIFRKGDKRWGIPVLVLAILISLSRLYVAVHYPSDVIVGIAIGIIFSYVGEWTVEVFRKSHKERKNRTDTLDKFG